MTDYGSELPRRWGREQRERGLVTKGHQDVIHAGPGRLYLSNCLL